MPYKKPTPGGLQQKVGVLHKLYNSGCCTEKDLQALSFESILKIPNITVPEMTVIIDLQKATKNNKLFSFLMNDPNEQNEQSTDEE